MRKVTLLLIGLTLVVAGSLFATGVQEAAVTERPIIEYTTLFHFDSGDPTENLDLKEEFPLWFNDYFNVDLRITFYPRPEYPERISLALATGEISGIIRHFGGAYAAELWADGSSMDWLPLIQDNPNWQKLEPGMQEEWMRDGVLVGFPTAWMPGRNFSRHIRKDWLDNLGLPVPQTIEEFYTAMRMFTENDPNQSGANDTVGLTTRTTWLLQDMFHAFGVPLNHVGAHAIATDPHDGDRFNDGMLKPQMVSALQNLADLYAGGYLDPEAFTIPSGGAARERVWQGYAGSIYDWTHNYTFYNRNAQTIDPDAEFVPILGLTSEYADRFVNPGGGYGGGEPLIMVRGTRNAKEQANLFLDLFLGNEIAYWSGRWGVYEKYWEFGPNREIVRLPWRWTDDGNPVYAPGPSIYPNDVEPFYALWQSGYITRGNEQASKDWQARETVLADMVAEGLETEIYFQYVRGHTEPRSPHYDEISSDIRRIFLETVTLATTGQMTPQQALDSYRSQMRAIGAQRVLDEGNAAMGKTSSTQWRY